MSMTRAQALKRWRRDKLSPHVRFDRFVRKLANGCWKWIGGASGSDRRGPYGHFWLNGKTVIAHKYSYERHRGPVPKGKQLDHIKCNFRLCVNPWHVEPSTARSNTLRSNSVSSLNLAKTHCLNGHPFSPENTYLTDKGRCCRTCARIAWRKNHPRGSRRVYYLLYERERRRRSPRRKRRLAVSIEKR
jgi:hypothetical protein